MDRAHFSFGPKVRLYVVFEGCVVDVVPYSHCEHACPVHVQARFSRSDCYMYVHVDLHVFVGIHLNNRAFIDLHNGSLTQMRSRLMANSNDT